MTYETALLGGGVQTHSVLSIGEEFTNEKGIVIIKCQAGNMKLSSEMLMVVEEVSFHDKIDDSLVKVKNIRSVKNEPNTQRNLLAYDNSKEEEEFVERSTVDKSDSLPKYLQLINVNLQKISEIEENLLSPGFKNVIDKWILIVLCIFVHHVYLY